MKKLFISLILIMTMLATVACSQPVSRQVLRSEKPRLTAAGVSGDDLATLVEGNSEFAFKIYQILKEEEGNLFYSPYSISMALAMTYAGARGGTETEMADTLRFILPPERLHAALNSLDMELARRGVGAEGKDGEGFRINVVNAIWGQKDYKFLQAYLDLLAENYGAGLRLVDFMGNPEESRSIINQWVSAETEDRIKDLLPEGSINTLTRLVLTNAIYFNAAWQSPFHEEATTSDSFYLLDGAGITVPLMKQTESFGYAEGGTYQAVELPYDGNELSMVIVLPKDGQFAVFENAMDAQQIATIIASLKNEEVVLVMPKFEFESEFGLKETLSDMGMPVAFSTDADFSGMTGNRDLLIKDVVHKAFVSVDEKGTEAAAATGVIVGTTSMPLELKYITLDHPFIFVIRDIATGAVLFVGRVVNPNL